MRRRGGLSGFTLLEVILAKNWKSREPVVMNRRGTTSGFTLLEVIFAKNQKR